MQHLFKKLRVWQLAIALCKEVYSLTKSFPKEELFGMTSQMKRASISIAANIAEGAGRGSEADFARFLAIANGSAYELETHLIVCFEVGLISVKVFERLNSQVEIIQRMTTKLIQRLKQKSTSPLK